MDRKNSASLLTILLVATLLAGCSASGTNGPEIIVKSQPFEVRSAPETNTTTGAPNTPVNVDHPKGGGHIAGVVVDPGIHPLVGVSVRIASLDLTHITDRDGVFSFTDLYPGPYYLRVNVTGYQPAQTFVEVQTDAFVRVKFILEAYPPPTPYHSTMKYEGFNDVTSDPFSSGFFGGLSTCGGCTFAMQNEPNASAYLIEAQMDAYQYSGTVPGGTNSFQFDIQSHRDCCSSTSGQTGNPMRVQLKPELLPKSYDLDLNVYPVGFPLPETSKSFEVFVTTWYNSMPPFDWSALKENP